MRNPSPCCLAGTLLFLASGFAHAQLSATATLRGVVTDQQRNPIAEAHVTVINDAKSARQYLATTNEAGAYVLMGLLPGTYSVRIEAAGFKSFLINELHIYKLQLLDPRRIIEINAMLQIGAVTQSSEWTTPPITTDKPFFVACGPELRFQLYVREGFWNRIQNLPDAAVRKEYAKSRTEANILPEDFWKAKQRDPDEESWSFYALDSKWNKHVTDSKGEAAAAFETLRQRALVEPGDAEAACSFLLSYPTGVYGASVDLSYSRDIPKVIKKAGGSAFDPVTDAKSGLVLGLLEASPDEDITILSGLPASRDIGRSFKSYLTRTPIGIDGIYAIKLEAESTQGPSKSAFRLTSEAIQPIFSEGKFNEPSWNFRFEAASDFGEASFSLKGYLLRFPDENARKAGQATESQEISVPISHPIFKLETRPKTITIEYWKGVVVPILTALIGAATALIIAFLNARRKSV